MIGSVRNRRFCPPFTLALLSDLTGSLSLVYFSLCDPGLSCGAQDWLGQWNVLLPEHSAMPAATDAPTNRICVIPHDYHPLCTLRSPLVCHLGEVPPREDCPRRDSNLGWTRITRVGALCHSTLLLRLARSGQLLPTSWRERWAQGTALKCRKGLFFLPLKYQPW